MKGDGEGIGERREDGDKILIVIIMNGWKWQMGT